MIFTVGAVVLLCVVGIVLAGQRARRQTGRFGWDAVIGLALVGVIAGPPLALSGLGLFHSPWAWSAVALLVLGAVALWGNHAQQRYGRFDDQSRIALWGVGAISAGIFVLYWIDQMLSDDALTALSWATLLVATVMAMLWLCWIWTRLIHLSLRERAALVVLTLLSAVAALAPWTHYPRSAGWLLWSMAVGAVLGLTQLRTWRYLGWVTQAKWQSELAARKETAPRARTGHDEDRRKSERKGKDTTMTKKLCPAQQEAFDDLTQVMPIGNVYVLWSDRGRGRTTVLRELHRVLGGAFLNMKDFVDAMHERHPLALEETFERVVIDALRSDQTVIVDDLHLLTNVVDGCGSYPRSNFLDVPLTVLVTYAEEAGKKLIFGHDDQGPAPVKERCYPYGVEEFEAEDYEFLCRVYLGPTVARGLDYKKIHRFAPHLNAHQLKSSCLWLKRESDLSTASFIEYLRSQEMTSNVDLGEVQAVDLRDLKGIDDVIESLEANMVLPLEEDALAAELGLKPKRGVLLAGPPGTGKTTIGRALAHRLKSKFFLVDGTFISGTGNFYGAIHQVFQAAKDNAPSIIFIDDSDVIFQSGEEAGLYRYLLTMLDGVESESVGRVCVMMTAMDVGHLPPALLRSGRIELWLELGLPDDEARAAILQQHFAGLPPSLAGVDLDRVVEATEGFTGADLKRLAEDGKTLFAYDKARRRPLRPPTEYFLDAVETVRANKERYAEAEARARRQHPERPPWFDSFGGMAGDDLPEELDED